jgi:hypothetical protein
MHTLPLWFLVLSLLLPRVSLVITYFQGELTQFSLSGWIPLTLAVLIPRALILILIFEDRGFGWWLLVHAAAMVCTYLSAGSKGKR